MSEQEQQLRAPTEEDQSLAFAFLKFMKQVDMPVSESEAITTLLADNFKIDPNGVGGSHDAEIDISSVWKDALAAKNGGGGDPMKDEKFVAFLELLQKKGYFNNCEKGSDEYETRVKKAHVKFLARQDPYAGLTADQLKVKGNELVAAGSFKEALNYYTKAIELDGENHIYYSNRAAAHSYLKDYRAAILDCEKAISINHEYPKAHSRLGHALFHEKEYTRAAVSYRQACNLDPSNETYKADLKLAEDQIQAQPAPANPGMGGAGGMPGFPGMMPGMGGAGGMPGMPPGMDMNAMNQLMQNPQFMESAMKMMQNPNFGNMMQNMYSGQAPDPQAMQEMMAEMGPMARPQVNPDGTMTTPFGTIHQDDLKELLEKEDNPKFQAIRDDVRVNGMAAFQKYSQDPEFLNLTMKLMGKASERQKEKEGGNAAIQ